MVGLSSVASVAMIAILYGFFVGACKITIVVLHAIAHVYLFADVTLTGPLVAVVTDDMSELGSVSWFCRPNLSPVNSGSTTGPVWGSLLRYPVFPFQPPYIPRMLTSCATQGLAV